MQVEKLDHTRFQIGDWVCVKAEICSEYTDDAHTKKGFDRVPLRERQFGQVVGITKLSAGQWEDVGYGGSYDEPPEPWLAFQATETKMVWLVRLGMMNRAIKVLDRDLFPVSQTTICKALGKRNSSSYKLPKLFRYDPWVGTERNRKMMQEVMKNHPRDEKGRWKKLGENNA